MAMAGSTAQGLVFQYQSVSAYQIYEKHSEPQGLSFSADDSPVFNITLLPPKHFHDGHNPTLFYCYGDPQKWVTLFRSCDATDDGLKDWEMKIRKQNLVAERFKELFRDPGTGMSASETQDNPADHVKYIIKHPGGDSILDDRKNRMLFIKCFADPSSYQVGEASVFVFKRIFNGQRTVMTGRELERIRLYLVGTFDGETGASSQGGGCEEDEDEDEDLDETGANTQQEA